MKPVIHHITNKLSQFPMVESVILFGSRARGDHRERSDIDLAVVCPDATIQDWFKMTDVIDDAPTLLKVDLIRFEEMQEAFQEEINVDGIVLYERKEDPTLHV